MKYVPLPLFIVGCLALVVATTEATRGTGQVPSDQLTPIGLPWLPASVQTAAAYNTPSYVTFVPTTGQTVTIPAAQSNFIYTKINASSGLLALTLAFPAGDHPGQEIVLNTTQSLGTVAYSSASGSVVGALVSWALNGFARYYWDGANWNRCG